MASMELHYASPPPAGSARRRSSADMAAAASTSRSSQAVESSSNAKTGETPTTMNTASDNTVAVKESNTASRILDELLGDMLSIVEEQDSSSDEGGDERNVSESESWSTSSSTSDAEDNNDTLTTLTSKVGSPLTDSEKEEGELESEHELESKRIQAEAKLKEAEERKRRREEKKKQSIERNVSERDVYRYLKHRGFPTHILSDYTRFCLSQSHPTTSFPGAPSQNATSITTSNDASSSTSTPAASSKVKEPTKEELRLLSPKYSFNKGILNKAKQLRESQNVVGRLLENCMKIVAEEEARNKNVETSRKGKERAVESRDGDVDAFEKSGKGNYMGRKKMVDKSVETDSSLSASSTAARSTSKVNDGLRRTSDTTTRLPTPTSPPSRTSTTLPIAAKSATSNGQASSSKSDAARAAKAAQLAAQFKYVLNTKHLNYNKADLKKFQLPRKGLQLQPEATTVSSSSYSSSAGIESRSASSAAAGAAAGQSAINSGTAVERSYDTSRRELPNGPRAPSHPALNGMGSTRTGTATGKEESSSSRHTESAAGFTTSAKATTSSTTAAASTQQQSSAIPSSKLPVAAPPATPTSGGDATRSNASHQRATSIYDMVPEYIVHKKKSSHTISDALPVISHGDDQPMQIDTSPTGATSTNALPPSTTEGVSNPSVTQMTIGLPSVTGGDKGKVREINDGNTRKEDVAQWVGSAETDHGAVYSPLEMDAGPQPPSEPAPSTPAPPSTAPTSGTADTAPSFTARPVKTSMTPPPPPSRGSRQGSAGSPPPSSTSSLPAPPSHLPARPNVPAPTDPKVIKAMFLSSSTKSSANSLPKKTYRYNPIQSTNEPVALPQREVKSIDPRKLAAERAKMLREERESESDRAGSPTLPTSATTIDRHATSISAQQPTGRNTSTGRTALLQGQKDVQGSSASPDIAPQRDTSQREATKANTPPIPSKAQQAANANMPPPSFRKAGQTNKDAHDTAAVNTDQREAELRNKLKRNREENEGSNSISHKRPTRDVGAGTVPSKLKASNSDSAKDTSPPPSTRSKNASTSSSTAPTSTRSFINSQARRVSDLRQNHDVSDLSDEDGAVTVAASRSTDKASSPAKKKSVPVVEVEETASRQGSVASSVRGGSADSRSGTVKKVVARKSTGGPKKKIPSSTAPTSVAASASQSTSSTSEAAEEPIKSKFTTGGSKNANDPSASQTSSSTSKTVTSGPSKPNTSQSARKVIEIDDSSDDTDEDDIPLRKPPSTVTKAPRSSTLADIPAATPPSSANKPRLSAKPLAGSGKRLSYMGTDDVDPRRGSSSTEGDDSLRPLRQSQKPSVAFSKSNNEEATAQLSTVAVPTSKKATSRPRTTRVQDSPPVPQARSASPATEPVEEDEIVSDSVSEAYSPSQMPRYSPSPVPDQGAPGLPVAQSSSDVVTESATSLDHPAVKMTQVASSQSPEDSQALRRASDAAFDEDIDMLASDSEDNAIAEDLLQDTLDDLPDLLPAVTGEVQSTTVTTEQRTTTASDTVQVVQETTSATTVVDPQPETNASQVDPSTQRNFVDPMDLSQAFGSDEEDGGGKSLSGHLDASGGNEDQPAQLERDPQEAKSPTMKTGSRMETASFPEYLDDDGTSTREQEPLDARHIDLQDVTTQARTSTSQPKRATAADFMASQEVPAAPETASDRTPVLPSAVLPAQVSAGSAGGRASAARQYTSPTVPSSEVESFEIIMEGQSPTKSLLQSSESTSTPALDTRPRVDLSALDRPLEDPLAKCRYGTGCLDMNCIFAHPSPSLPGPMSRSAPFPTSRLECGDGLSCRLPTCPYTHPSPAARRKEICANQANCPYGAKCVYRHVDQGNSQLAHRYTSHNQSARFNNPVTAPPQQDNARQHLSRPPSIVPGTSTLRTGNRVTSTTLPFYLHRPMPAMPAGTPPLSRSASPAVNVGGGANAGTSGGSIGTTVADNATTQATSSSPPTSNYQQQQQQVPQQGPDRSWTDGAKGWLASFIGASKPN